MQRPDRDYGSFDPSANVASWFCFRFDLRTHWRTSLALVWQVDRAVACIQLERYRPHYDVRIATSPISTSGTVKPGPAGFSETIRSALPKPTNGTLAGDRQDGTVRSNTTLTFLNFWVATIATGPNFAKMEQHLTRGGPLMRAPKAWTTTATLRNRAAARNGWNASYTLTTDEAGGRIRNVHGGISFTPKPRWQFSVTPTSIHEINSQQYVATVSGGPTQTYGQRYIFSFIDRSTWSSQFRLGYTLRPDLNIDVYSEPFAASGHYYGFGELTAPRTRVMRIYGTDGTTISSESDGSRVVTDGIARFTLKNSDFNIRSFRSNVVLRWEWHPGSILYLVWQQNRRASEAIGDRVGLTDMFRSLSAPGSNFFAVKMSFWLPIK